MIFPWRKHVVVKGIHYLAKDPSLWTEFIPIPDTPINYLEIGVLQGVHTVRILGTYCRHPDSRIYCVDPWEDYDEYKEYKGKQSEHYNDFLYNMNYSGAANKYVIKRGYSNDVVPTFEDDFFDLIFIDGNHGTEFVYNDGVMSLQKLKPGGCIVFDDYDWKETKEGIDKFVEEYKYKIRVLGKTAFQLFVQKL